ILCANLDVQTDSEGADSTTRILDEAITGLAPTNVLYPNFVSIYKRGEINDTNMYVTGGNPPNTPTGLTAQQNTINPSAALDLSWNSVTNLVGYDLWITNQGAGTFSNFVSTAAGVTLITSSNLFPGTTYYYEVSAFNSFGESTNSPTASAKTRTNATPTLNS